MNFEQKVRIMTARQIIEAMISGLENEHVKVDMGAYGEIRDGVCYGCAATNTICEISGLVFTVDNIVGTYNKSKFLNVDFDFLHTFESAIDFLREGAIGDANSKFLQIGASTVKIPVWWGWYEYSLGNSNYKENLKYFRALAEFQDDETVQEPE